MESSFKQNSFSRSMANDLKMGAYYTNLDHCRRIGNILEFPDGDEVCVIEPSIGDGTAVLAVTGKKEKESNFKIFGVELNSNTYEEIKNNELLDFIRNADFLNGVKISHNVFSFCFANPPYGELQDEKERLETKFVEKLHHYMMPGGILALVIPYYVLKDDSFLKVYFARFNPLATFRFDDDIYSQFQQIVVIGAKRNSIGYMRNWYDLYYEQISEKEKLAYLPAVDEEIKTRIKVMPSYEKDIEYFTTLAFDSKAAGEELINSTLYSIVIGKAFVPPFNATKLGRPPVPLKKDLLYLCAISGGGQGLVGSEESTDLHLQRGSVKTVVDREVVTNGDGSSELIETTRARVCLNVIQNDGTITVLE